MSTDVIIYTSTGCPKCKEVKEQLQEWGIPYEERNITESKTHFDVLQERKIFGTPATFINNKPILGFQPEKMQARLEQHDLFTKNVISPDSTVDSDQHEAQADFSEQSGDQHGNDIFTEWESSMKDKIYDFVTIGGGPAGASAAIYAARSKLKTLVIDKAPIAGTLALTHKIANYPGIRKELTGLQLLLEMQRQAKDFGAQFVRAQVLKVEFSDPQIKVIETPEGLVRAKSVFIGVGAEAPSSKIKGEDEFVGRGVSYCSTCDAAFYDNRTVVVAGDTEEAVHEALVLSKFCKEVILLLPTEKMKGEDRLSELASKPNIRIYKKHRIKEISGNESVGSLTIADENRKPYTLNVDGVFLYLAGMKPGTDFIGDSVERDSEGYIVVDERMQTSVAGVFAGGDARKTLVKQAVISAADGCIAALGAESHLNQRDRMLPQYS